MHHKVGVLHNTGAWVGEVCIQSWLQIYQFTLAHEGLGLWANSPPAPAPGCSHRCHIMLHLSLTLVSCPTQKYWPELQAHISTQLWKSSVSHRDTTELDTFLRIKPSSPKSETKHPHGGTKWSRRDIKTNAETKKHEQGRQHDFSKGI